MSTLADRLRDHAALVMDASPLVHALLTGAADELGHDGPVRTLLAPLEDDPPGSVPGLRLAGALHRLVLERRAPLLALHVPSVGGTAPPAQAWPAARAVVAEHLDALHALVRRPVQTNEVGRSAALLGGLALLSADGLPVRLLEVGASAGLNLHVDRYAVRVDGVLRGDAGSPVVLDEPWQGALPPDVPVRIVERAGCDPDPLDPRSERDRLTLSSYVWGDQPARFARLGAALAVAATSDLVVERASGSDFLRRELAQPRPGVRTVVWQSVVRQYLSPQERADVDAVLDDAGTRATAAAPLALLALEPADAEHALHRFRVTARTWPGGVERVLADADGHGSAVVWRPDPA